MAIQDDAKNFLLSALSRAGGDLPSLQLEWLATQGYTRGTIDDRWQAYLSANAYYLPEGLSRLLVGLNRAIGNNWLPNLLYQTGDILLWYDPSDLTTMFTDTTGTTQVSADGDSVALMLDKGQWGGKSLTQVLAAQPAVPLGTVSFVSGTGTMHGDGTYTIGPSSVLRFKYSLSALNSGSLYEAQVDVTSTNGDVFIDFCDYDIRTIGSPGLLSILSYGRPSGFTDTYRFVDISTGAGVTATINSPRLKEIPGYHRVQATGTSMPKYKTDGTLHWLLYDGTDDSAQTPTINWGTDEVAICAGVTKSSDAAATVFAEFSTSASANNGAFAVYAPGTTAAANYLYRQRGSATSDASYTNAAIAAPVTSVLTGSGKISTDLAALRINGVEVATAATDQGSGNFGSYALNFGRRNNASLPFNGSEYQTVIRSRLLSTAELAKLETFVAAKTGVIL